MAARRFAWILNLDADVELGSGPRYAPKQSLRAAMTPHIARLATSLLGEGDILVDESGAPGSAHGSIGRAFCPTPRALAVLKRAGAEPEMHPTVDVLRRVNSRAFASGLGATLPGAAFVVERDRVYEMLATDPKLGPAWRVKHAFGMTGRNQRVIGGAFGRSLSRQPYSLSPAPTSLGPEDRAFIERGLTSLSPEDRAFIERGLATGGVQIEPHVTIEHEYALHGFIAVDGTWRRGNIVAQRCDARGAWVATERLASPRDALGIWADALLLESRCVARALYADGYFGPFGVDAFTYRDRSGVLAFQPRSEINARYSMGFATGFDGARFDDIASIEGAVAADLGTLRDARFEEVRLEEATVVARPRGTEEP